MKIFIKLLFVISFSYASVVSVNDIESIALNFINQKNQSNMQYEVDKITKVDNLSIECRKIFLSKESCLGI